MEPGKPSRTAMAAAGHRMIHQLVDRPVALADPLANGIKKFGRERPLADARRVGGLLRRGHAAEEARLALKFDDAGKAPPLGILLYPALLTSICKLSPCDFI